MAKFKLSLINLKTSGSQPTYFKQTISEFYSQRDEYISQSDSTPLYSYCYTYNEKFSETTNSQKKLSFSMDKRIIRDDRIEDNPFTYNIAIGTQLLLEDKYGQHHLLTVSDIQFDFKEFNLVYNYQCQDSFTWQLSRQNNGYEIVNDPTSEDFIGALNIDDWSNRIYHDCNIAYQYKKFLANDGSGSLYKNYNDYKRTIPFSGSGTANSLLISLGEQYGLQIRVYEHFNDNGTITKEFAYVPLKDHHPSGLKYSPYYDIQSFGLSHTGTSLASIMNIQSNEVAGELVSLIPSMPTFFKDWFTTEEWRQSKFAPGLFSSKCQSKTIEFLNGNRQTCAVKESGFDTYQTFICTPINHTINLTEHKGNIYDITFNFNFIDAFDWTYSTLSLIYSYSFLYDINDRYVYQLDSIYWYRDEQTSIYLYENGEKTSNFNQYSTVVIKNYKENKDFERCFTPSGKCDIVFTNITTTTLVKDQSSICIPLTLNHADLQDYDYLSFSINNSKKSHIYIEQTTENGVNYKYHYNTDTLWRLCCGDDRRTIRAGIDKIPEDWKTKDSQFYVVIPGISPEPTNILNQEIYINFYRNPTEEELEFAAIADQCPWLENKLINFDYFYNHHIINQKQYQELQDKIQNELRLASADLLYYSQSYYQAIENKTQELSDLANQIDMVGATFNADFISPYNENKPYHSSDFILAYSNLTRNTNSSLQKNHLIDYEKTITQYLNHYINAEQTFLKNMYLFRKYFEEKVSQKTLYTYEITLSNESVSDGGEVATFSYPESYTKVDSNFTHIHNGTPSVPIYQKNDSIYTPVAQEDIIALDNYTDDNIYYLNTLNSIYQLNSTAASNDENNKVIKDYSYNNDQQYFEQQWAYNIDNFENIDLWEKPVIDSNGHYELFKVDTNNGKAYIRSYNHCIQNAPYGTIVFNTTGNKSIQSESLGTPTMVYEPIGLYEMKCNWLYQHNNDEGKPNIHHHTNIELKKTNYSQLTNWVFNTTTNQNNLIRHFPNTQNDFYTLESDNIDAVFRELYAMNLSLPKFQYQYQENGKTKSLLVDFVNYNNAATKYRRISVSNGAHKTRSIASAILALVPGISLVPISLWGITEWCWRYGNTSWGTEGWTYQDLWGDSVEPFNSSWYSGVALMYTKNESSWNEVANTHTDIRSAWSVEHAENFLHTYNSLLDINDRDNYYYYKPINWRFLSQYDYLNPNKDYKVILTSPEHCVLPTDYDVANLQSSICIDAVINYPLSYIMNNLPLNIIEPTFVNEFLTNEGFTYANGIWTNSKDSLISGNIYIIAEEDFDIENLSSIDINTTNIPLLASEIWYDENYLEYDWVAHHASSIADGFYIHKANENYQPAKEMSTELQLDDVFYYRKDAITGKMIRLYTFNQLVAQGNIYYRSGDSIAFKTFNNLDKTSYLMNIYQVKTSGDKKEYIFKEQRSIEFDLSLTDEESETLSGLKTNYSISVSSTNLDSLTHGQLWCNYKNNTTDSVLLQEAMVIESNLTELWTNAYYASKNCRYFLPQFWQPLVSGQINYFSNNIITIIDDNITLLNNYIPTVSVNSQQPKFQYKFNDTNVVENNEMSIYYTEEPVTKHYNSQPWLKDIMQYLGLVDNQDDSKCSVMVLNHQASYYTKISGGTTWYQMLNNIGMNQYRDYSIFGGWYDMAIKVLQNKYQSYIATQYNEARRRHNQIWKEIYTQYPNLVYEQQYSNTDAINSSELLAAAQFAFKQYTDIERQYNIQTIDLASLKGYEGQHLRIGDAIELDADELYEEYDDIKTSLMQYLFISDINYDLRSDADIQLTVNNIKYSDKVIGELVKLIR